MFEWITVKKIQFNIISKAYLNENLSFSKIFNFNANQK
jgi:hypothetical protein